MTSNLLDLIKRGLPADFADLASKAVGESPGATQTALTAALPALVGAIAQRGATAEGAQSLLSLLDNPAVSTGAVANLSALLDGAPDRAALTGGGPWSPQARRRGRRNSGRPPGSWRRLRTRRCRPPPRRHR